MSKLLYAGIRRYVKSLVFWFSVAATILIAIRCGYQARELSLDDVFIISELTVMAMLITWLVGREGDEGIFRNKMIAGHSKGTIFMSELILAMGACVLMFLLFAAIVAAFNSYIFSVVPVRVLIRIFFGVFFANMAMVAIFVSISCLIPHRAIMAIVNVLLAFGLMYASYSLEGMLDASEYFTVAEYEYKEVMDENGEVCMEGTPIPGTEKQVKNDNYVDGWRRKIVQFICDILPTKAVNKGTELVDGNFGYRYYIENPELGETYETSDASKFFITKEEDRNLTIGLVYTFTFSVIVCLAGYFIFRKKDFR